MIAMICNPPTHRNTTSAQDNFVLSAGGAGTAGPSLNDTYALLVEATRSACALRLRFGSQMPWGASKQSALHEVPNASPAYKRHERNWSKLVKTERIHLMSRTTSGCFYLPDFLLTRTGDTGTDSDWTVNREAVQQFVETGVIPTTTATEGNAS